MTTFLVVDSNARTRNLVGYALRQQGFDVLLAADSVEAGKILKKKERSINLVLVDNPETLLALRRIEPKTVFGFLTGSLSDCEVANLLKLGAVAVFQKPVADLANVVNGLAATSRSHGVAHVLGRLVMFFFCFRFRYAT